MKHHIHTNIIFLILINVVRLCFSTSGSTSGFRQNDPGMRRWQSLSYLAPEGAPRSFPGAELRAAQGESSYRQSELVEWMQDAHERLDTQLDLLKSRDAQLNYNITTAQLLDMKHKVREFKELKGLNIDGNKFYDLHFML